nr:fimbrial protein [uncultured Moellerella sp.]
MDTLQQQRGFSPLSICLLGCLLSVGMSAPTAAAPKQLGYRQVDNWGVDGQHGILRVKGALTDSPCRLSMRTTDQTIDLGTVAIGDLPHIGSEGRGVTFQIELTDCLEVANGRMDKQTGQALWSPEQPGVAIRFMAPEMDGSGRYAQINGVSGLGLVLNDVQGNAMQLGQYSRPQLLPVGQSTLTYTVAPVKVANRVSPGAFYAVMGFQLSYD